MGLMNTSTSMCKGTAAVHMPMTLVMLARSIIWGSVQCGEAFADNVTQRAEAKPQGERTQLHSRLSRSSLRLDPMYQDSLFHCSL
jgi:hypothetical protein